MAITAILKELRQERQLIDEVITRLERVVKSATRQLVAMP
jgi:hypothetical protein